PAARAGLRGPPVWGAGAGCSHPGDRARRAGRGRARTVNVVAIVGPTASGKSALALRAAARTGGEIVSADSRQVYRGMDVGTAKPTAVERRRVPHHGLDLVDPGARYDAARYQRDALEALRGIAARGRVAYVV